MAKSIRINFIYNIINTVSGLLFPLITYPYVFRVLLAEGVGQVNFYNSIISYITLFTSIGIPLYGVREIARVRDDIKELTMTTVEILSLNLILNILGYIFVIFACFAIDEIKNDWPLFILLSLSIFLSTIGCPWFYGGIEDFKYTTVRSISVRVFCVIFLFLTVRSKQDLYWYGLYYVLVSTGNNIVNFILLHRKITFSQIRWRKLNLIKHIKPAIAVFVFNLVTSIYVNLDKVMLGFIQDSTAVGYYTAATMLSHVILSIATALGVVVLPRSSNLIKLGRIDDFYRLANKSYRFLLMLSMPLCIGCLIMAPSLIHVFCGENYEPSIITLRIISPIIVALGMSNLIGLQMLYPLGKITVVTISTCVGAGINLALNLILIPLMAHDGAAIATLVAESSVTTAQILIARKYIKMKLISTDFFRYFFSSLAMGAICFHLYRTGMSDLTLLIVLPSFGALIYGALLIIFKDSLAFEFIGVLRSKLCYLVMR